MLITGNTYPVKDKLRAMGGRWDALAKGWIVPDAQASAAQALVASAPKTTRAFFAPTRCKSCGCGASRYNRIYGNGICKDCYVSEKEEREMGY